MQLVKMREKYPKHIIIAGNVATPLGRINLCGVDIVKVGIGPEAYVPHVK